MGVIYPSLPGLRHIEGAPFFLIAGPCVIENESMPFAICERLLDITGRLSVPLAFKASYRKANRTSINSFTGIGDSAALAILDTIRKRYGVPVVTDVHSEQEAAEASAYADVLQVPAFLCRQTSLLEAVARTGCCVNIKKGQFLSPEAMAFAVEKMRHFGNGNVMLTERGTTFGYQDLVLDFRSIPLLKRNGVPVVVDITHSLQHPNQKEGVTGGDPEMIETMGRAAVANCADGIFIETHPDPAKAKSDGANMLPLDRLEALLNTLVRIGKAARG